MFLLLILCLIGPAYSDISRTNMVPGRSTIVHLFEWKWRDIAEECERFLGPHGFGGVQVSPASENLIIHLDDGSRPWYERYQVMSYKIKTRSGNEQEFLDMTKRCSDAGVRIYVDVVVNHMTGNNKDNVGTAGSTADFNNNQYYGVPYGPNDFHPPCQIKNYYNVQEIITIDEEKTTDGFPYTNILKHHSKRVRNCQLDHLKDLNQSTEYVRTQIKGYFNTLISLGVGGFRVDAAKHIWPSDLKAIYDSLNDLNTNFGFAPKSRPYIYQEVAQSGNEPIKHTEYTPLGDVTEFRVGMELKSVFRGQNALKWLVNWGEPWNLSPSDHVLVFIDNHDTQRYENVLNYKEARAYKAAIAFMLAHPYGSPRIMSSYFFNNDKQGPPSDSNENIISPSINPDDTCGNGWVCEHRWRQIYQMVAYKNAANNTEIQNWWDNGNNQIAFSRGQNAFIVFNLEGRDLKTTLQTGLPPGNYCDVITGKIQTDSCTGRLITVKEDGKADIDLPGNAEDLHLAIHVGPESSLQNSQNSKVPAWGHSKF